VIRSAIVKELAIAIIAIAEQWARKKKRRSTVTIVTAVTAWVYATVVQRITL